MPDDRQTMDEEALLAWQDVLDEVMAGRTKGHRCPFCREAEVTVDQDGARLRIDCPKCHKFFEGRLGMGDY
jgi:hypothetical protein